MKKAGILIGLLALLITPVLGQEIWVEKGEHSKSGHGFGAKKDCFEREAFFCGKGHNRGRGMRGFRSHASINCILKHSDELELTDDQQKKLKDMQFEFRMAQIDKKADVEKAEAVMKKLIHEEAPENEVLEAIDNVTKLKGEIRKLQYQHHISVKSALSEKQWDKLKTCNVDEDGDKEVFMKRKRMRHP